MADGLNSVCSYISPKSSLPGTRNTENKVKLPSVNRFLRSVDGELTWHGNLEELKQFIDEELKLSPGKWSSPGGETKLFVNEDIKLK